jgi:hypothetical protein
MSMPHGSWVLAFLERSRSSSPWATDRATWSVWLLEFESPDIQVSTRSSSENRTETTTMSISRGVNRGLFGSNSPAAHERVLERGQALVAPAFRAVRVWAGSSSRCAAKRESGSVAAAAREGVPQRGSARGPGEQGWLRDGNARRRCRPVVDSGPWARLAYGFGSLSEESCDLFCPFAG